MQPRRPPRRGFRRPNVAIARMLNCSPDEIVLVENATVGWCQAFYGLAQDMEPGDNVTTVVAEYAFNFIALLQMVKRCGIEIVVVPNDPSGQADVEALEGLIDERTKLIAVTHVPTSGGLEHKASPSGVRDRVRPCSISRCAIFPTSAGPRCTVSTRRKKWPC